MKNKLYIFLSSMCLMTVITSCSDLLGEKKPTTITGVYDTESMLEANIAGVAAQGLMSAVMYEIFGAASGITTWGVTGQAQYSSRYIHCMNFSVLLSETANKNFFLSQYIAIQRANLILANLPDSPVADDYKLEIEAECRFYRAMAYFNLVRYYGDVPLRLTPPAAEDATYCPVSPYYEVYAQVVRDFEYASNHMRTPERALEVSPMNFRPHRYAAVAYLSSVFTHIGSLLAHPEDNFWDTSKAERLPDFSAVGVKSADDAYRLALKYSEQIIPESSAHDAGCPYRLVEKIQDLYQFDGTFTRNGYTSWKNPEQIMISASSIESANTNYFTRNTVPNYCPDTEQSLNSDNTARLRPSRFLFETWCSTYPGEMGTISFADVHISSADPRVEAVLWFGELTLSTGETITTYPYSKKVSRASSFPYFKKYWSSRYTGSYSDCDYYHLRLAEIYLNAAEAAAWLGDEATAKKYVEVIHARARHSVPDGSADSSQPSWAGRTFGSKDELITAIFWERIFELCGEAHEFTDTHRFGAKWLSEVIAKPLNKFNELKINTSLFGKHYAPDVFFLEDETLLRKSLLCPLPQLETDSNSGITHGNDFNWGI